MADDTTRKVSYYNTLIFTIISGIVSVSLLVLLLFKPWQKYTAFIVTLEVGIFVIIAICIVQIVLNESRLAALRKAQLSQISFGNCPDYYTKRVSSDDTEICSNDYVITTSTGKRALMKIYPEDDPNAPTTGKRPLPATSEFEYRGGESKWEKFPLNELDNEPTLTNPSQKCAPLFEVPNDPKLQHLKGYNLVPWTTMRAKCATAKSS